MLNPTKVLGVIRMEVTYGVNVKPSGNDLQCVVNQREAVKLFSLVTGRALQLCAFCSTSCSEGDPVW